MKLFKKVVKSARKIKTRRQANLDRGNLKHSFASFFDALPSTPPGPAGAQAFSQISGEVLSLLSPKSVISLGQPIPELAGQFQVIPLTGALESAALKRAAEDGPFALWSSAPQTPDLWRGVGDSLAPCLAMRVSVRQIAHGDKTSDAIDTTEFLIAAGYEPLIRCTANADGLFDVLFLRRDQMESNSAQLAHLVDNACEGNSTPGPVLNQDIPVLIPCFNNQTYCRKMVQQLRDRQFRNITLIDNASTNPAMHRFLDEIEDVVAVDRLGDNLGPKKSILANGRYDSLPRYFCVTDPDIAFNPCLPKDFVAELIEQARIHQVGKAGFALDILHRQFFKDTVVKLLYQDWKIWEWEERFWADPIGKTRTNDTVFKATVDTTFAVYDKELWSPETFIDGLRVAGRFTAGHVPWYAQSDVPSDEREAYSSESSFSYYKM